ncbi:MAG: HlyD family efflux transporter periplasmic adaptor subunit [bacterium]|nr:HlyD family efflux transporter periplasmic adaptor subunit [bacterium]
MRAVLLLMIGAGAAFLAGCGNGVTEAGGSAFIEANDVLVSAEMSGRILEQRFGEGATIAQGDTLLVIDPSKIELEIASAEANRQALLAGLETAKLAVTKARESESYAKSERDRIARLLTSGSATRKQMDQLEHEVTLAVNMRQTASANVEMTNAQILKLDADIARLRRQLQDVYLLAPASGVMTEDYVDQGELVTPGKAVAKIAQLDTLWAKVYLPSSQFASVKIGDAATISTESGETSYQGKVIWTSSEAEFTPKNIQTEKSRANLVYAVKVSIPNSDGRLKIGMPVFVTLGKS